MAGVVVVVVVVVGCALPLVRRYGKPEWLAAKQESILTQRAQRKLKPQSSRSIAIQLAQACLPVSLRGAEQRSDPGSFGRTGSPTLLRTKLLRRCAPRNDMGGGHESQWRGQQWAGPVPAWRRTMARLGKAAAFRSVAGSVGKAWREGEPDAVFAMGRVSRSRCLCGERRSCRAW